MKKSEEEVEEERLRLILLTSRAQSDHFNAGPSLCYVCLCLIHLAVPSHRDVLSNNARLYSLPLTCQCASAVALLILSAFIALAD